MEYVSYDIKGIQQFIYSVPKLKCVIGTSSHIYEFDNNVTEAISVDCGAERTFGGGGRGVLRCARSVTQRLSHQLVEKAHTLGLDIRLGVSEDFGTAIKFATKLYPYLPNEDEMSGVPCALSGLWPVGQKSQKVHRLIRKRLLSAKEDRLGNFLLEAIDAELLRKIVGKRHPEFFLNVRPEKVGDEAEEDPDVDRTRATASSYSLGNRNRWAIIALDGNDVGSQFDRLRKISDKDQLPRRVALVSNAVRDLTKSSLVAAIESSLSDWARTPGVSLERCTYADGGSSRFVLPIRPLVCGGDDVVLLCHSSLAMPLVESMCSEFERGSIALRNKIMSTHNFDPWPASSSLTMSGGMLYSSVSLPLHVAIPYAQSLLASAKARYRRIGEEGKPSPAAVDWEAVTDSIVDTPSARRRRELVFTDREIHSRIHLTRKPYLLFDKDSDQGRLPSIPSLRKEFVEPLRKLPSSFRAELQVRLTQPWSERTLFLLSAAKMGSRAKLVKRLRQPGNGSPPSNDSAWVVPMVESDGRMIPETHDGLMIQETGVIDAILLVEEEGRLKKSGNGHEKN